MSQLLTSTVSIRHSTCAAGDGIREGETTNALQSRRLAWQRLVDFTLVEWGRDPTPLDDDGVKAPTGRVIRWAIEIARNLAEREAPAPTRVVPNGDGGIVFELTHRGSCESIEIESDGTAFHSVFFGSRLIHRAVLAQLQD